MTEHRRLIEAKLRHLERMSAYLSFSLEQVSLFLPVTKWEALSQEQHESLAAFRIRFSEFQEHLGKAMRAVAMEEEQDVDRFGSVLTFMERLGVLDREEDWRAIRDLRNAVNHEYEEDGTRLYEFFDMLVARTPQLLGYFMRLSTHCKKAYGLDGGKAAEGAPAP